MEDATGVPKLNCWEVKACGRGPRNSNHDTTDICPAALCNDADTTNAGVSGGRVCWAIAGTMCGGRTQGTFALKFGSCMTCEVFLQVRQEEGDRFLLLPINRSPRRSEPTKRAVLLK
ncbi:hypothetical protein C3F09_04130 [candidate division GN15 bacterium]|uniref:Uncharacterized protein n=1 Tax=candidate division GN15 bacterium TaxID=2072418 RepID=A0A855X428_9BACT|nr:MAG: hypothetical protein C3F09_04130 [candidate division GN15 bacterium]